MTPVKAGIKFGAVHRHHWIWTLTQPGFMKSPDEYAILRHSFELLDAFEPLNKAAERQGLDLVITSVPRLPRKGEGYESSGIDIFLAPRDKAKELCEEGFDNVQELEEKLGVPLWRRTSLSYEDLKHANRFPVDFVRWMSEIYASAFPRNCGKEGISSK
jgi:hypothetical protein